MSMTDKQKTLASVVPGIEKARLYRGKGGEIMRAAVSRFIECISISKVALPEKIKKSLLDTLNENLRHPNSQIQVLFYPFGTGICTIINFWLMAFAFAILLPIIYLTSKILFSCTECCC
jgi:hypothetical protein